MPLPDNFSPTEHLQDVARLAQNDLVRHEFRDVVNDNFNFNDVSTPRRSLATACYHLENDSIDMTNLRMWLFFGTLRKARDFQHPVYGLPIDGYQISRKFKPQIFLYFLEPSSPSLETFKPVDGVIRFRLMNETSETITQSDIVTLAQKIKAEFGIAGGYTWHKGKQMVTYTDAENGYKLQLLCRDTVEGKRIISSVLDLRNKIPDWKRSNIGTNQEPLEAYPTIPPNTAILGKPQKQARKRPTAGVVFRYALLHLHGLPKPICLYDRTKTFKRPLVA